jgi:hypothetical protein
VYWFFVVVKINTCILCSTYHLVVYFLVYSYLWDIKIIINDNIPILIQLVLVRGGLLWKRFVVNGY